MNNFISWKFYEQSASHSGFMSLPLYFGEAKTEPTPFLEPLWILILTTLSVKYGMKWKVSMSTLDL